MADNVYNLLAESQTSKNTLSSQYRFYIKNEKNWLNSENYKGKNIYGRKVMEGVTTNI